MFNIRGYKNMNIRDDKHRIIPAKLSDYELHEAFKNFDSLDWHCPQSTKNIKVGDIVYIYVSAPESCIRYKCEVTKINIHCLEIDDTRFCKRELNKPPFFEIKKINEIPFGKITLENLRKYGIKKNIQGPQHLYKETLSYIESLE